MHLVETAEATAQSNMEELVLLAGVDPVCASDVAGAIMTFCRARHGGEDVHRDYHLFLIERSGFRCENVESLVDHRDLLNALRASNDPAALYEAFRRGLVYPVASDVDTSGRMLMVNLKKIHVRPHEDTPLNEWPVVERLVDWVSAWRRGSNTCATLGIRGAEQGAWREFLPSAIVRRGEHLGLQTLRFVWLD
ncbi:MAG: hypothetical protein ACO3ZG_06155 [Kiritimatiellia bacterium]